MLILITGAAGMVGKHLVRHLLKACHQVIPIDFVQHKNIIYADLRDKEAFWDLVKLYKPDLIIHLAALTDLRFCEQNKEASRNTNYGITEVITTACSEFQTRLIFFSSDYVFGKQNNLWQEKDSPCPTTQYGIDKAASEYFIQETLSNYAIVRTAQLYGFSGDFVNLVCHSLTNHQEFIAYANLINCPTWISDLFAMLDKIILYNRQGIFHCVGPEALSRYQYAFKIAESFALNTSLIYPFNLDFLNDIRPPIVRLSGSDTYKSLQFYPGKLNDNLQFYSSYEI